MNTALSQANKRLAAVALTLALLLSLAPTLTSPTAQAYDIVEPDKIVSVTASEFYDDFDADFNALISHYWDEGKTIIELGAGTYTISKTVVIEDPVIIRAAEGLTADDIIIDGGAFTDDSTTDTAWLANIEIIHDALIGYRDNTEVLFGDPEVGEFDEEEIDVIITSEFGEEDTYAANSANCRGYALGSAPEPDDFWVVDQELLSRIVPSALLRFPVDEEGRGERLWDWARHDLLALDDDYTNDGEDLGYRIDTVQRGDMPIAIAHSIRYADYIGMEKGAEIASDKFIELGFQPQKYFNNNRADILWSFEEEFADELAISASAFEHQFRMENPYAMIQGVTLQHFMGVQLLSVNNDADTENEYDKNRGRTHILTPESDEQYYDYMDVTPPALTSAVLISGSMDRCKVTKNFMADVLAMNNGLYLYEYNKNVGGNIYRYIYRYSLFDNYRLLSPIVMVSGGSVSNTLIAYNGYSYEHTEGALSGYFNFSNLDRVMTQTISYTAGDYSCVSAAGFARFVNNTIANNNVYKNFLYINGDLVLQNNILISLTKKGAETETEDDDSNDSYYAACAFVLLDSAASGPPFVANNVSDLRLDYEKGGWYSESFWGEPIDKWKYFKPLFATYKRQNNGLDDIKNFAPMVPVTYEYSAALFTNVPVGTTGYRNTNGTSNDELEFDFTPKNSAWTFKNEGVDCFYPQIGLDAAGNPRILGDGPDLGAYEGNGDEPKYSLDLQDDTFYITLDGAGKGTGTSLQNAYAGKTDIQAGIIKAHRAGATKVVVGAGEFPVHGKPYLYIGYANGFVSVIWDGIVLAPVADSPKSDTTKGMSLSGTLSGTDTFGKAIPSTVLTGQICDILKTDIGALPYFGSYDTYSLLSKSQYRWQGVTSHTARTTYGARVISQVEPVKALIENCVIQNGYVATELPSNVSADWTISEEIAGHNTAKGGAGVYLWNGTIENCIIRNNYEARAFVNRFSCGGGIFLNDSSVMRDCVVENNYSETTGGGVLAAGSDTIVERCLVRGNVAFEDGGGIATGAQPATEQANNPTKILNTVISGNYALGVKWDTNNSNYRLWDIIPDTEKGKGGGLLLHESAEVKGCTIANNFAPKGDNVYMSGGLLKNTAIYSATHWVLLNQFNYHLTTNRNIDAIIGSTLPYLLPVIPFITELSLANKTTENALFDRNIIRGQMFKFFILPELSNSLSRPMYNSQTALADLMLAEENFDNLKANIINCSFRTVVKENKTALNGIDDLTAIAASIGDHTQVYSDMTNLFVPTSASYNNYFYSAPPIEYFLAFGYMPSLSDSNPLALSWPDLTAKLVYEIVYFNSRGDAALVSESPLARAGVQDADMLKDYYGGARLNNDIGAYASAYLGGSADANYYTVAYAKGTKDAVTDMPGTLDAGTVAENGNQTVSAAVPKRAGYTFIGWEADDNNKTTYQPKSSIENITRDIVLTALWEVTPTLTYHPNGGAGESKSYPVPSGSKYTLYNADVVAFSRSGFYFTGWNAEPDGEGASYAPGAEITMPKDGIILYAQWGAEPVDPETYTVTYDASGGEGGNTVSGIEAGSIHTLLSITEAKVSRAGYTFIGWNAEPDGEGASYAPGDLFTMPGTDTTFYARWEIDASKPSGGGGGGGSVVILPPKTPEGTAIFSDEHYAYITGYPDGTVRPGADISRAELATIIFRLLSDETRNRYYSKTNGFSDVEQGEQWANTAISTVSGMGVVKGYPDGTFAPEKPMTRAEFATMLARFYDSGQDSAATHPFSDVSEHWAEREIARAYALGLISGYPDGTFRPDANITRAEAVTLINRITDRCVLDDPADMLDGMIVWPDNMNIGAWYYYAVQEASNSHEYVHGEDNHYWTKLIPNRDWLTLER